MKTCKRGHSYEPSNVAPACKTCNSGKKDRLLSEWYKASDVGALDRHPYRQAA